MKEFNVEGQTLTYEILGEGEPFLFVNNIAADSSALRGSAPGLNQAGYQVVLNDYLGPDECTIEEIASRTGQLLDHLDIRPWVWGVSQGAMIAQELALQRPDRVRAAMLVATIGRRTIFLDLILEAYETLIDLGMPESVMAAMQFLTGFSPDALSDDERVGPAMEMVKGMAAGYEKERSARSLAATKRYGNRLDALKGITVPCLVMAFELDVSCGARLNREVADAIPECEYVEIAGASHMGPMTHTAQVFAAASAFLAKAKASGR